ncbi:hypothetical protein JTE90_016904 [Oedothorax gibbosus]|uniref:Uncharacterized protein n=1 Tax=Oedothorax gibbosus TaxID=931172 RepID=A0AAV6UTA8_9ARAC|nr:hypothetical protein JTE90_016904 [Oedothorax gibbosus]
MFLKSAPFPLRSPLTLRHFLILLSNSADSERNRKQVLIFSAIFEKKRSNNDNEDGHNIRVEHPDEIAFKKLHLALNKSHEKLLVSRRQGTPV